MDDCSTPIRVLLDTMSKIRLAMPKMQQIWVIPKEAPPERDEVLNIILKREVVLRKYVDDGIYSLGDCVMLNRSTSK